MKSDLVVAVESVASPHPTRRSDVQPAADAAATFLLGLLTFCLLCFVLGAWVLARRSQRSPMQLPPEEADPKPVTEPTSPQKSRPPWERDADWWKKE